jgi:hypothetical protein
VLARELERDAVVGREQFGVRVDLGIVTMSGSVTRRLAKDRAAEIAHVIRGVRAVIDGLILAPPQRSDDELEFLVAGVLSRDPVTAGQPLAASTRDGVVRLWGHV